MRLLNRTAGASGNVGTKITSGLKKCKTQGGPIGISKWAEGGSIPIIYYENEREDQANVYVV